MIFCPVWLQGNPAERAQNQSALVKLIGLNECVCWFFCEQEYVAFFFYYYNMDTILQQRDSV